MTGGARRRLGVGLIGLGRLGRVYARDLAARIPETRVSAFCDIAPATLEAVADELGVARRHLVAADLINDRDVEAVVIATPTGTHRDIAIMALKAGKPTFCEKPPALTITDALEMKGAVESTGVFFQMGFMRRFDPGYVAAKKHLDEGRIGKAILYKSTSRDPNGPAPEFVDPGSSGGLFTDMGIHDFDLARFFMGEVASVSVIGGAFAPEIKAAGDVDNAVVSLTFQSGTLGVVDLSRRAVYGYEASTELLGDGGSLRVGYLQETPLSVLTRNSVANDVVPSFLERFDAAFTLQLQDFARNVLSGRQAPLTIDDGVEAVRISVAARRALLSGRRVDISSVNS